MHRHAGRQGEEAELAPSTFVKQIRMMARGEATRKAGILILSIISVVFYQTIAYSQSLVRRSFDVDGGSKNCASPTGDEIKIQQLFRVSPGHTLGNITVHALGHGYKEFYCSSINVTSTSFVLLGYADCGTGLFSGSNGTIALECTGGYDDIGPQSPDAPQQPPTEPTPPPPAPPPFPTLRAIHVYNFCGQPIEVALSYKDYYGRWVTDGYWKFQASGTPGSQYSPTSRHSPLKTISKNLYYFAYTTAGKSKVWKGDHPARLLTTGEVVNFAEAFPEDANHQPTDNFRVFDDEVWLVFKCS